MSKFYVKSRIFLATLVAVMAPAFIVYAALNTLNGLSGASQTFATTTDANIGLALTSSGSTHTFIPSWSGMLSVSRGGTGNSAFTSNSIPFFDGSRFTEDNNNLWWDGSAINAGGFNANGGEMNILAGGQLIWAREMFGNSPAFSLTNTAINGQIALYDGQQREAVLDVNSITDQTARLFTFPNFDGTFALLQGLSTSTIKIGDIKSCIVMADSDGSGVTYVTANDGMLSATTTHPLNCQ